MEYQMIAGVDEAGRGPLAGPVIAAAVILDPDKPIANLTDSKLLSDKKRQVLYEQILDKCLCYGVGRADVAEIDSENILNATMLAMQRAVQALSPAPQAVWVDGNKAPDLACPAKAIIQGDLIEPRISAASIIAKVTRDKIMVEYDELYPQYGFAKHKGYGTKVHLSALAEFGVSPIHRRSFAPVRRVQGDRQS